MTNKNIVEFEDEVSLYKKPEKSDKRYIIVSFDDQSGVDEFAKLMNQRITSKTKKITYGKSTGFPSGLFSEE